MKKILATLIASIFFLSLTGLGYLIVELNTGSTFNDIKELFKIIGATAIFSGILTYCFRKSIDPRFVLW